MGRMHVEKSAYDLASVIVINVGESCNANYNGILKMLSLIFRTEVEIKESHEILVNEFGFPKRHFNKEGAMKSWAMDIEIAAKKEGFEKGIAKGIAKGIEKGIEKVAKSLLSSGIPVEQIGIATGLSLERIEALRQS